MEAVEADVHHVPGSLRTAPGLVEKPDGVFGGDDAAANGNEEWILVVQTGGESQQGGVDGSSGSTAHPPRF
ncbi:hypothetical protein [Streptomyces sp. NPDC002851]